MKRIGTVIIAFALIAYSAAAAAVESTSEVIRRDAPRGITEAFYACIDKADGSTIAEGACLTQEKHRQNDRLNSTYKTLMSKLDKAQNARLVEAERAWLKFQDSTAQFEDTLYGGEIIDNLQLTENEIFITCKRADKLNEYLAVAKGL